MFDSRSNYSMNEYEPSVEYRDGLYVDMFIETILACIYDELYSAEAFDATFTNIVRYYINPNCPDLVPSIASQARIDLGIVNYLVMLCFDFEVISAQGPRWPAGGFDFLPEAVVAVSIRHADDQHETNYAPGKNLTQAVLAAVMQLAREIAIDHLNQPEFPLEGDVTLN